LKNILLIKTYRSKNTAIMKAVLFQEEYFG